MHASSGCPHLLVITLTAHARAFQARPDVGGERIPLSEQQFTDLITVHLADWLEQVRLMLRRLPCHVVSRQMQLLCATT